MVVNAEEPGDLSFGDGEKLEPLLGEKIVSEEDLFSQSVARSQAWVIGKQDEWGTRMFFYPLWVKGDSREILGVWVIVVAD